MAMITTAYKKLLNVLVLPLSFMLITSMAQAQVTSLTATLTSNGYVNLSWTNPAPAPSVFEYVINSGTPQSITPSGAGAASFQWIGVGPTAQDSVVVRYFDFDGAAWIASAPANITLPPPNRAPVANAGPDQTVSSGAVVTLDGRGSTDLDNDSLTYSWVRNSLYWNVTLQGANTAQPTFTAPTLAAGAADATVVLQLTVNDGTTNSATFDEVQITVQAPGGQNSSNSQAPSQTPATPAAPTALTAAAGDASATIIFTAGADGGAAITNYEYELDGSGTWTALNPADTSSPVTISSLTNGSQYSIKLRAVNSVGAGAASAAVSVTPQAGNQNSPTPLTTISFDPSSPANPVAITPSQGDFVTITNGGSSADTFSVVIGGVTQGTPLTLSSGQTGNLTFSSAPTASGSIQNSTGTQLAVFTVTTASQPNSQSATATATAAAITADVFARTTATISGNTRMMDMALTRFLTENRSSADDIITRDSITGPLGLQVTGFNLDADDNGGSLFSRMSYMDVANGWRRVGFTELSFQDTQGVGSTLSVTGRISQERYLNASTLYGYFLGAELHRSDIEGSFAGEQDSWGVLAGVYTVMQAENGLIGSAYGALGFNRSDVAIGNGSSTVADNYDTRSVMLGAKLSGDLDYTTYRLRPSLEANYAMTDIGTLSMIQTANGVASNLAVPVGTVRFMDIVVTPEFIIEVDPIATGFSDTEFSIAPRLTCERRDAATDTRKCGSGLALGLSSNSRDGMTTLNGGVSFDRIGGQDRQSIQLQAVMRF